MLLDHLERLMEASSIEAVWSLHCDEMAGYGFDRLLYGVTRFRTAHGFGDPSDTLILSNHPSDYLEGFLDGGLYMDAPMVRWAAENDGARTWSGLAEDPKNQDERVRKVMDFNRRMGVTAGVSISFRDGIWRNKGSIGLVAPRGTPQAEVDRIWAEHGRDLKMMNEVMHLRILNLPYMGPGRSLTKRQREALEWVGAGKTNQDIATIMGLTPATVEKHLRLAREALDVDTTAQAVFRASIRNQIFVLAPKPQLTDN